MNRLLQKAEARRLRLRNKRKESSAVNQKQTKERPRRPQAAQKVQEDAYRRFLGSRGYQLYTLPSGLVSGFCVVEKNGELAKCQLKAWPAQFDMVKRQLRYDPRVKDTRNNEERLDYIQAWVKADGSGQIFE